MIFRKWTHARVGYNLKHILNKFEINLKYIWAFPLWILCDAALPCFFPRKNRSLVFCNLKQCFLQSTKTIFNGTRLDRRGLKNECLRFQYGTKPMARKFQIWNWTWLTLAWGHPPCQGWSLIPKIIFCGMRLPMQGSLHGVGLRKSYPCQTHDL